MCADMLELIISIIFGIAIAFFAIQNGGLVAIHLSSYTIPGVPLYLVVLGSVLLTLIFSWIIFLVNSVGTAFTIHGKNSSLKTELKENRDLRKKIQQLEVENARLKGRTEVATAI